MRSIKYKSLFVIFTILSFSMLVTAQNTPLPYYCGFETSADTAGWMFKKRASVKCNFTIGKAIHRMGASSLYVSTDGGTTAGYSGSTSGYVIVAYRKFTFAQGTYNLLFDFKMKGKAEGEADAVRVAIVPTSTSIQAASNGSDFPAYVKTNSFVDANGVTTFTSTGWKTISGTFSVTTAGDYYLVYAFKSNSSTPINPGPCIDNVQISNVSQPTDCHYPPTNVTAVNNSSNGVIISWNGNAPTYDIMYYTTNSSTDTSYTIIRNISGTSYTIPYGAISEGLYSFKVRATCAGDTSHWVEKSDFLLYDPSKHCLDYMNFNAAGVTCTWGTFANPYQNVQVKDYGYASKESMHTIHYLADEYDRLTGYDLKTVPDGSLASVRLSNWTEGNSPSGSITYTYTVSPDAELLLLHYAAVLQYASHHPASDQTRIHVEILGPRNTLLSPCTEVDFNAKDVDLGNTRGWKTYIPTEADGLSNTSCPIKYLDWQILGINMKPYVGQTVKVKITLYACSADYHFGYAYFALDCTKGSIEGISCGSTPEKFVVSEGFDYKWYLMNDPNKTELSNDREFIIQPNDTNSYCVDMIFPEDPNCYFTLKAYTLPRLPKSAATFTLNPHDCINEVVINNQSAVYKYQHGTEILDPGATIDEYFWDFGEYGTSTKKNPTLAVKNEGDTFNVLLRTVAGGCEDIDTFVLEVPAIKPTVGNTHAYICEGESVEFNGKVYTEGGVFSDTLVSHIGCDSILTLTLEVLQADTIFTQDSVCSDMLPYIFHGVECNTTGTHYYHQKSSLGCDTLIYACQLEVLSALDVNVGPLPKDICSDQGTFDIPYDVQNGALTEYKLDFNQLALTNGFKNTERQPIEGGLITVQMPDSCRPDNRYSVDITFYNRDCGDVVKTVDFTVFYSKNVLTQRWNDVLSLKNSKYNGGYTFMKYEWYYNDQLVEGHTQTQFYVEGQELDFNGEYRMKLTRMDDQVEVFTCPFVPQKFPADQMTEVSTLVLYGPSQGGNNVRALAPRHGQATIYTMTGIAVAQIELFVGENALQLPLEKGIYVMKIQYDEGDVQIVNIVVQ